MIICMKLGAGTAPAESMHALFHDYSTDKDMSGFSTELVYTNGRFKNNLKAGNKGMAFVVGRALRVDDAAGDDRKPACRTFWKF